MPGNSTCQVLVESSGEVSSERVNHSLYASKFICKQIYMQAFDTTYILQPGQCFAGQIWEGGGGAAKEDRG